MGIKIESDEIDIGMGDKLDTGKLNPLLFALGGCEDISSTFW